MRRGAVFVEASCLGSVDLRLSCIVLGQVVQLGLESWGVHHREAL